jgi:putative tryptophan/tyrosine transport system ATP-binding protein
VILELERVSKSFTRGPRDVVRALDDVSLLIEEGTFTTIVGSNGAGKSTLLNVIAGAFPPDRGWVRLGGRDITRTPAHHRARFVGRVHQDPGAGTAPGMSVEENVAMALKRGQRRGLRRGVNDARRKQFREYLELADVGLETRLDSLVRTLSGGQRQALALMMAAITSPAVLLLDEHTAALDPRTARKIMDVTDSVVGSGRLTTLMVTHNMEQAIRYGNRLLMMHQQRIVLDIHQDEKRRLTVADLVERFEHQGGERYTDDRLLGRDSVGGA